MVRQNSEKEAQKYDRCGYDDENDPVVHFLLLTARSVYILVVQRNGQKERHRKHEQFEEPALCHQEEQQQQDKDAEQRRRRCDAAAGERAVANDHHDAVHEDAARERDSEEPMQVGALAEPHRSHRHRKQRHRKGEVDVGQGYEVGNPFGAVWVPQKNGHAAYEGAIDADDASESGAEDVGVYRLRQRRALPAYVVVLIGGHPRDQNAQQADAGGRSHKLDVAVNAYDDRLHAALFYTT